MFGKKLFDTVTPYSRTLLVFKVSEKEVITLPAINTAVFFLSNGDKIYIDSLEGLDEYSFIDYSLINDKKEEKFLEELRRFKDLVKENLIIDKPIEFIVERKLIFFKEKNFCAIELQLANYDK